MKYKNKTVLVYDLGLFVEWAVLLAKDFGTVYYYSPWESSFPKSNPLMVGAGLPGITRVKEVYSLIDEVDLWVFPDVYHGTFQMYLEKLGKRVWGSRIVENIELDRVGSKQFCAALGIDIGSYAVVKGLDDLREYLRENDNQYVKISTTRGDMETFHSKNYQLIEPRLDELEHNLGTARKNNTDFIVEQSIEPAVEAGYDGFTIDGQFPQNAMFGIEIKDKGFLLRAIDYDEIPKNITAVNAKLAPAFKNAHYRGFWSTEVRITDDGTAYFIDPCPRSGSPPSELYQEMISNWPDILWEGAGGVLVEPEFTAKWGAELLLISSWADKNWQAIEFPPEIRDHVKLRYCCEMDGRYYSVPQFTGIAEVGAVVAIGDTEQEAIDNCKAIAEKVEGHYVESCAECLDNAQEELDKLEELNGIQL